MAKKEKKKPQKNGDRTVSKHDNYVKGKVGENKKE